MTQLFQCSWGGYVGVNFPSCKAVREINTKITHERVQKQLVTRVYTSSYFLHDATNPKVTIKMTIFTHHPCVSLTRFSFCWWRHNRLLMTSQWPDNCDAITWIVLYVTGWISILFTAIFTAGRVRIIWLKNTIVNGILCYFNVAV